MLKPIPSAIPLESIQSLGLSRPVYLAPTLTRIRALHRVRVTATRLSDAIPVDPSAPPLWTQ